MIDIPLVTHPIMPTSNKEIIIIGAGGIVRDAHLPAYKLAGFIVKGIYDLDYEKSLELAKVAGIGKAYQFFTEVVRDASPKVVFDIALPAASLIDVLKLLPDGSNVLMQKPMGDDLEQAELILQVCRKKKLNAAVNFQLRYAPFMLAAKDIIRKGWIGELCDIEFHINAFHPWHLWKFLFDLPRMEILYHSIHYMDFIRSVLGNPLDVYGKTTKHPNSPGLASVRSNIIMDYGDNIRASIHTNHNHDYGLHNQNAYVQFEGTKGAIKIDLGLLIDYPKGVPDKFEFISKVKDEYSIWTKVEIEGTWFPHAFIGSMAELMRYIEGSSDRLDNSVEDVIWTMRCVEAAYESKEISRFLVVE